MRSWIEQRLVIGMFYYEQMSVKEIAETLGCSENTVKSRLNYGRKKVEVKVRDLEKQGTKLYSLAPIPFLLWLFRMDAQAGFTPAAPVGNILSALRSQGAASAGSGGAAGNSAGNIGRKAAGKAAASAGAKGAGKALTMKIVAGVLAGAIVGGGAVAAITSMGKGGEQKTTEPTEQTVWAAAQETTEAMETSVPTEQTEPTLPPVTAESAYEEVIADYRKVISVDQETYQNSADQFINEGHSALYYYHAYHSDNFYYAYYDINHDGVNELLIGFGSEERASVVDVYGFDGDKAIQLVDEPALGDRAQLQIMTDGTMYLSGSGGAMLSSHELLKIGSDGCSLEQVDSFLYDLMGVDTSTQMDKIEKVNGQMAEFQEKVAQYTPVEDFSWILLEPEQRESSDAVEAATMKIVNDYRYVAEMDHDKFNNNEGNVYELIPHLDEAMYYYHMMAENDNMSRWWYYATADLDGDGIEELFIGYGTPDDIQVVDCYTWNGREMVILGEVGNCHVLSDGTLIDQAGNGGEVVGIYRLENSMPVNNPNTNFQLGFPEDYEAYQKEIDAHGGYYQPNHWQPM